MNGAAAQISSLSSGETDRCEYLTGEKIPPQQQSFIQEAKFTYLLLEQVFEKQGKTI